MRVGAGRAAEAEVDPAREQPGQDRERLGDLERAVVRQHHAAAADADPLGDRRDRADQRLGASTREHRPAVVLGHPVTVVPELVGEPREVDRVAERVGAGRALGDRRLVEYGQSHTTDVRKVGPRRSGAPGRSEAVGCGHPVEELAQPALGDREQELELSRGYRAATVARGASASDAGGAASPGCA